MQPKKFTVRQLLKLFEKYLLFMGIFTLEKEKIQYILELSNSGLKLQIDKKIVIHKTIHQKSLFKKESLNFNALEHEEYFLSDFRHYELAEIKPSDYQCKIVAYKTDAGHFYNDWSISALDDLYITYSDLACFVKENPKFIDNQELFDNFNNKSTDKKVLSEPYLDPNHINYSPEIHILIETWKAIYIDNYDQHTKSIVERAKKFLVERYPQYYGKLTRKKYKAVTSKNDRSSSRIAKMINADKKIKLENDTANTTSKKSSIDFISQKLPTFTDNS